MLGYFLCNICFGSFGNIVGLSWSYGGKCFDHAMGRGSIGIAIFGRWCCYGPIGIGVANHFCLLSMVGRGSWAIMQDIGYVEGFLIMWFGGLSRDGGGGEGGCLEVFGCGGVWCGWR